MLFRSEHNIVYHAARRAPGYNAGIWQWSTDNSLIQLNEAAFTHGVLDGQGFDSDYNSRWTTLLYNYSHDNEGGFLLICTPVKRDDQTNLGNVGTQARFNVSHDDRTRIFQLAGASDALIEGNVIHAGKGSDVQMVVATQWDGWSKNIAFRGNFLGAQGIARYGHERGRRGGLYLIDSGFAPAEGISFDGNIYAGNHADPPDDRNARFDINYADRASWDVPRFDPAKPDGFDAYLKRHRHWMLAMLRRELRQRPTLLTPSPTLPDQARRTVTGTR